MRRLSIASFMASLVVCLLVAGVRPATAQVSTANLSGRVLDPKGLAVPGARVRIESLETGAAREITTDEQGGYLFLGLPPGRYRMTVLAKGFATLVNPSLTVTLGQQAIYNPTLNVAAQAQTVTVSGQPALIETTRSSSSTTIVGSQINDLPINRRDYINFSLLTSTVKRDDTPSIGAAPTSGLDFNGQRGRGNDVMVDGADAVDASTSGIRSTVSQEAVQEFQVLENNYDPQYGRAVGGVVNIVTKSGTNDIHGNAFGFLRNQRFQARNPFSVQVDPTTGQVTGVKQGYTRVQAGATLGGALQQNKFFYFFSFEMLRSQETGFSDIGSNNFGLTQATVPCLPSPVLMTSQQISFFQQAIPAAGGCSSPAAAPLIGAAGIYAESSATALFGIGAGTAITEGKTGVPTTFPLPVDCNPAVPGNCTAANVVPLPQSYVGLASLIGNFPANGHEYFNSIRLDRIWTPQQRTSLRVTITPSYQGGIQVNAQNQNFGQNAGSRTSTQQFIDQTGVVDHSITLSNTLLNESRFQYARRGLHYGFSPLAGGSNPAVNIVGVAFLGREPFSTVDRTETRWEGADNLTWIKGQHSLKFGVDANYLKLTSSKPQIFELNYGGVYNFGALDSSFLGPGLPSFTAVQAYGLGIPQVFIQGIGKSFQPFDDKVISTFAQDSWQITPRLTMNYGVRYDLSLTPIFPAATTINQQAGAAMNVVEGLPRDYTNVGPRLAFAWDPSGNGKTVVRAGFGLFYGVPPLAIAFDAATADGAQSNQLEVAGGVPTGLPVTPSSAVATLNASSIFQGIVGGIPTITAAGSTLCGTSAPSNLGYVCTQQRFNPTLSGSLFVDQNYLTEGFPIPLLPFTLPSAGNFVNGYSEQGSLSVEQEFAHNYKIGLTYTYVHGIHLNRARNINQTDPVLLDQNFKNAIESGLPASTPLGVQVPGLSPGACQSTTGASSVEVLASGALGLGFASPNCTGAPIGYIGTPAVFNFFRPSGPNPSFGGPNAAGYSQLVALAKVAGYPTGFGVPVAWSDVEQQESSGSSVYNGFTLAVSKQFSNDFQFLSSWTYSHSIDDSTDLSTLLDPQNNLFPNLERGNSTFDQRQRWVTSAIFQSPYHWKDTGFVKKLLADSFVSPIIDVSTGRPYTVLTGTDYNMNFSANTDRPSVVAAGTPGSVSSPFIPNVAFTLPTTCPAGTPPSALSPSGQTVFIAPPFGCTGNLGRNTFYTPGYFDIDLRLDRKFYFHEQANFELIADVYNLLNRFNPLAVNLLCNPATGSCSAGQPTAAFDPRIFQFAVKLNF
jgi:hypothetical protein